MLIYAIILGVLILTSIYLAKRNDNFFIMTVFSSALLVVISILNLSNLLSLNTFSTKVRYRELCETQELFCDEVTNDKLDEWNKWLVQAQASKETYKSFSLYSKEVEELEIIPYIKK